MSKKIRADELLVERALCETVEEARRYIMAGQVRIGDDRVVHKANEVLSLEQAIFLDLPLPYVSRGALKLKPAFEKYVHSAGGLVALDLGSSTGGFTDFMLQAGVTKVYAVDVGTGQLHYKLRQDPRVISLEQTNARTLSSKEVPEFVDLVTSDVSFISVTKILAAANCLMKPGAFAFILVKPQFEAPRNLVGDGVIRDEQVRLEMVKKVTDFAFENFSWIMHESIPSPIKGPKGNQEYVVVFQKEMKQ
jgi:23S rRNA (cytidine1920-2'-O)/16S rRNA (cytidine1409-2'-O)-methyltransferase